MNSDVGRLLREGMGQATDDVRVPAGLVRRVVRRYRRRRVAALAAVTCVVAGVTAGVLAAAGIGVTPGTGRAGGTQPVRADTVAYVLARSAQAVSQHHLVEYARSTDLRAAAAGTKLYELSWAYGIQSVSSTGRNRREIIMDGKPQAQYANEWGSGRLTVTAVEYQTHTWHRGSVRYVHAPSPTGCAQASPADYYAFLQWGLHCAHDLRITGRARVDGVETIKIVSVLRGPNPVSLEFWVKPQTYLPVRTVLYNKNVFPAVARVDEQTDYEWLAPTPASLAKLAIQIPAGFRWDPSQPRVDFCGFIPCN